MGPLRSLPLAFLALLPLLPAAPDGCSSDVCPLPDGGEQRATGTASHAILFQGAFRVSGTNATEEPAHDRAAPKGQAQQEPDRNVTASLHNATAPLLSTGGDAKASLLSTGREVEMGLSTGPPALAIVVLVLACVVALVCLLLQVPRPQPTAGKLAVRGSYRRQGSVRQPDVGPASAVSMLLPRPSSQAQPTFRPPPADLDLPAAEVPESEAVEEESPHLCPELVVPDGSECTLLVPPVAGSMAPLVITDERGVPVFRINFGARTRGAEVKRLVLTSACGDALFAYCKDLPPRADGLPALAIYTHFDAAFGELRANGSRPLNGHTMTSKGGRRTCFRGDAEGKHVNAVDEQGRLLAVSEVLNLGRRSVRVGPANDAGLIVLCVLGIDLLKLVRNSRQ